MLTTFSTVLRRSRLRLQVLTKSPSDGELAGYAYAALYRPRPAYRHTIENAIYIHPNHLRQGLGRSLLAELIRQCELGPWRQMIAVIGDSANSASVRLHESAGFRHSGVFQSVGWKFGRWLDTVLMQRPLGLGDQSPAGAAQP
jgi:phosphinothricin acetyltransferase